MKPKPQIQAAGEVRRSQVISTFGPGAMLDLPDVSVIVGGLEYWVGKDKVQPIAEARLQHKVAELLGLPWIGLRPPPVEEDLLPGTQAHIGVRAFPQWFLAEYSQVVEFDGRKYRSRPLVPGKRLEKGKWLGPDRKWVPVVPVRFVQACPRGHISDIDWYRFAGAARTEDIWLDEGGAGNDFAEIYVRVEQRARRRQIADAMILQERILGTCNGDMPWIGPNDREDCTQPNRLLTRSASNAYFPQVQSVISIPDESEALIEAVEMVYEDYLKYSDSLDDLVRELKKPQVRAPLEGYKLEIVWAEVERRRSGRPAKFRGIKEAEVLTLRSQPEGDDAGKGTEDFYARTREAPDFGPGIDGIVDRVVLVHRLREVEALIGFTRFEAYGPNTKGELALGVERARLSKDADWVPAIENRGEGLFLGLSAEAIEEWLRRPEVAERGRSLEAAFDLWKHRRSSKAEFPGLPYYALHSLAHLLITSVSLACGYSASAIGERVYVGEHGYGILLYTGVSGSEGTLGGLVEVGRHIEDYFRRALLDASLCSNDPVCAQHDPTIEHEDRFLHGAACHACLLIAETSCENFNQCMDRALVVPSLAGTKTALFDAIGTDE